jgi:RNA polymerase sigma factor (sigma-70 family)
MGPTVHVVDDDEPTRKTTARLLAAAGFGVRTYAAGSDLLADVESNTPACIVLDVRMPGQNGFEIQEALAQRGITVPIVFLTGYAEIPETVRAIRDGAADFLTKPTEQHILVEAVTRAVAKGAADRAVSARRQTLRSQYERLTPREREVLRHLITGQTNRQVGAHLNITERTVKVHRAQILQKLQVASIAALVRFAIEVGLEPPGAARK